MMNKLVTLYKKNSRGALQQWSIFVDGKTFWAEYGQIGGAIQKDAPTICEGKNIGRANETRPEDQALLEAESKINKQLDKGYVRTMEETDRSRFTPMLAHEYGKHGGKLPNVMIASPKLDGIRLYVTKDGAFSRNGKPIVSAKFIVEDLAPVFKQYPHIIVDGEIYNHEFKHDFNQIVSLAKKSVKISDEDWGDISEHLQFHIFDACFPNKPSLSFQDRITEVKMVIESLASSQKRLFFVEQTQVSKERVDELHEAYLENGYEGIMLRDPESPYQTKRSYFLQKYKNFIDEEFKILDVEEGKGNWAGKAMKIICLNEDGNSFEAVPKGTEEYRRQLLLDKSQLCGKLATVKYQNRTPANKPRFGIVTAIRDYE